MKIVGLTLDVSVGEYASVPWYALRANYCKMIGDGGAAPLALPHHMDYVETYLSQIHGLVVTGGKADVDPLLYGEKERHPSVFLSPERTNFEIKMVQGALARKMPILGICGGHQVLNVVLGGTLVQHIPHEHPEAIVHYKSQELPTHPIKITKGTRLHGLLGDEELTVNTHHHQAVKTVGPGVVINATTEDGLIEGIELPNYPFCMGVQWHPEYDNTPQHQKIIKSFMDALL
jgi:putative glutamine amidotransferase